MKIAIQIVMILLAVSLSAAAQETGKEKIRLQSPLEKIMINMEEFDFYRELHTLEMDIPANEDPNTIKLWTEAALLYSEHEKVLLEDPAAITSPLYRQYVKDSKFNPFTYALGMAQAAAVGYMAYKHIKKYGLFK